MTFLKKCQVASIISNASFKSIVAFNLADTHPESTIPLLITHFLGESLFGMLMPVFDAIQAGPIQDSDAQSTAHMIFLVRKSIKSLLFQRYDQTCEIRSLGKSDRKGC
jgi:hypothetical protein